MTNEFQDSMKIKLSIFVLFLSIGISDLCAQQKVLTADTGIIKVEMDLARGGAISHISTSGSDRNLVNIFDKGRYIQQSYYAGRTLDRTKDGQSERWSPWSWNPIQVGDAYGNHAEILDFQQTNDTLYSKCVPMLWDMNNEPAEAIMEQWTILKDNVIEVHNKLSCHRTDTIYGLDISNDQELPAVYPISDLENLYTYIGNSPFTNDSLSHPTVVNLASGFWGIYPKVSEHWMAFVDDDMHGMAVYNPQCLRFLAGMSGEPGHEAIDASTSYIAPVKKAILNTNSVYEYSYYIIIGSLKNIRTRVYELNNTTI